MPINTNKKHLTKCMCRQSAANIRNLTGKASEGRLGRGVINEEAEQPRGATLEIRSAL